MYLKEIYLKDFRNYATLNIAFSPSINIIHGDNGQGKTNLLEAIYLLATGRSFRTLRLGELIREGASLFVIEAEILEQGISSTLSLSFDGQTKRLELNGTRYSSFHPLLGLLPSVLYSPNDVELISGPPAIRRRFFNLQLAQSDPSYLHSFTRYWQAMKQRNALLRAKNLESIECWEQQMAPHAIYIRAKRSEIVQELPRLLQQEMDRLSPLPESLEIRFFPSYPDQTESYLEQMKKNRLREVQLGLTLSGPHRDDFILFVEGKSARLFASEGQKKTATFALKLAQWTQLSNHTHKSPLLGIDDFGLHLDDSRQQLLRSTLDSFSQVFMTTPRAPTGLENAYSLCIKKGAVMI